MQPISKYERRQQIDRSASARFNRRRHIDQIHADRELERSNREVWDERPIRSA